MNMRIRKNEGSGLNRCKCVYFFRTEKWNNSMEDNTEKVLKRVSGSLYYTMDYFDFCFAVTPGSLEELLGKYGGKTDGNADCRKKDIGAVVSHFNECTSSRQLFSLCMGENEVDPFEQDRRHLIFTTLSLNLDNILGSGNEDGCYDRVNKEKCRLNEILKSNLCQEDKYNVYQVLSNEDFAVVIATNDPSGYFERALPLLRGEGYVHSYTIQGYGLRFGEGSERISFKGREEFRDTHLMRARMSSDYWERFETFPQISNPAMRIDEREQLIGKYNIIFKLKADEFYKVLPEIIGKKLGLDMGVSRTKQKVNCVIQSVDDICIYIRWDLFSYINERTLFHCKTSDVREQAFEDECGEPNGGNMCDFQFYKTHIRIPGESIVKKISGNTFGEKDLCINSLYRLQQIYESCAAMGRNLYLRPMVLYILQLIELFLVECNRNFESVLKRPECGAAFARYMIDGVSAFNTMFTICKDKIYDNLQAPNYDVDYTYATEKMLRAYGRILKKFSDSYIKETKGSTSGGNNEYYPLVIPDASQSRTHMKILFTDAAIRENDLRIPDDEKNKSHQSEKRILLIYSPFDSEILRFSQYLPCLTHELGHYLRPKDRRERNKLYAAYIGMLLEMGMTQSLCRVLGCEYSWELFQKRKIPQRHLVRYIAEESRHIIQTVFCRAAKDTLLDLYNDQLHQILCLLFQTVHPLDGQLRELVEKFMRMMEESLPTGDYQETGRPVLEAWGRCEDDLKRLDICGGKKDMEQQIIDCCNCITKSGEDKELEHYRANCRKLGEVIRKAEQIWMEKVWIGELDEDTVQKIKGGDPECEFEFTGEEEYRLTGIYHEMKKEYPSNSKEWARVKGYASLYSRLARFNDNFRYQLECIDKAENRLEVTDDIVKIQNLLIDEIFKGTQERLKKKKMYRYPELYRDLGLDCGRPDEQEERKVKFRAMWRKMALDVRGYTEELFVNGKYSFREAMADYTMCRVNKWSEQKYLPYIVRELETVDEVNIYRIAIVLLMLQSTEEDRLDMLSDFLDIPEEYRRIIEYTVKYLKGSLDADQMKAIDRIKEPIDKASEEFLCAMTEWGYMDKNGWREDDLTQIRFLLDFSYRSKYRVWKEQKLKDKTIDIEDEDDYVGCTE